jgi:hypothetical protein
LIEGESGHTDPHDNAISRPSTLTIVENFPPRSSYGNKYQLATNSFLSVELTVEGYYVTAYSAYIFSFFNENDTLS